MAGVKAGDDYRADVLQAFEPQMGLVEGQGVIYPDLARSTAYIRMRQAELQVRSADFEKHRDTTIVARAAVEKCISMAPRDPYLWFGLSWIEAYRKKELERSVQDLLLSYKTGAHEGWVAVRRNSLAFLLFPILSDTEQAIVVNEFQDLATSTSDSYVAAAALTIAGTGSEHRDQLLPRLEGAPDENRKRISKLLFQLGVDVDVPGVPLGDRPWN